MNKFLQLPKYKESINDINNIIMIPKYYSNRVYSIYSINRVREHGNKKCKKSKKIIWIEVYYDKINVIIFNNGINNNEKDAKELMKYIQCLSYYKCYCEGFTCFKKDYRNILMIVDSKLSKDNRKCRRVLDVADLVYSVVRNYNTLLTRDDLTLSSFYLVYRSRGLSLNIERFEFEKLPILERKNELDDYKTDIIIVQSKKLEGKRLDELPGDVIKLVLSYCYDNPLIKTNNPSTSIINYSGSQDEWMNICLVCKTFNIVVYEIFENCWKLSCENHIDYKKKMIDKLKKNGVVVIYKTLYYVLKKNEIRNKRKRELGEKISKVKKKIGYGCSFVCFSVSCLRFLFINNSYFLEE